MKLLSDNDIRGLVDVVLWHCKHPDWLETWEYLKVELVTPDQLGLQPSSSDADVWHACQRHNVVLLTGNRNSKGAESLEATLRLHNTSKSLPVITIANLRTLQRDARYVQRIAVELMDVLLDIEDYRGTGRLFIPR